MRGIDKLKSGDFNDMAQEGQLDGTRIITLSKRGERKIYRFKVRDLYSDNEEVISEEIVKR